MSKSSCQTLKLEAYWLDKDGALPKEKLKSLTERLCEVSSTVRHGYSIVTPSSSRREGPTTVPV